MNGPWGIAMDTTGNIHVSNYNSSVITVYNHEGQYLHQYGSGQFTNPIGIAVTADGFSVVTEYQQQQQLQYSYYSKVLIFNTSNYSQVATLQDINQGYGATCDRDGYIYVCDSQHQRIVKY